MNYEEYLLTHLIEECSEVIKAATKCQRFGKSCFWEKEGMTNAEAVAIELGDVQFLVDKLRALGWRFDSSKFDAGQRFQKALQISVDLGHVVFDHDQQIGNTKVASDVTTDDARLESRVGRTQGDQAAPILSNDGKFTAQLDLHRAQPPPAARPSCEDCD